MAPMRRSRRMAAACCAVSVGRQQTGSGVITCRALISRSSDIAILQAAKGLSKNRPKSYLYKGFDAIAKYWRAETNINVRLILPKIVNPYNLAFSRMNPEEIGGQISS